MAHAGEDAEGQSHREEKGAHRAPYIETITMKDSPAKSKTKTLWKSALKQAIEQEGLVDVMAELFEDAQRTKHRLPELLEVIAASLDYSSQSMTKALDPKKRLLQNLETLKAAANNQIVSRETQLVLRKMQSKAKNLEI